MVFRRLDDWGSEQKSSEVAAYTHKHPLMSDTSRILEKTQAPKHGSNRHVDDMSMNQKQNLVCKLCGNTIDTPTRTTLPFCLVKIFSRFLTQ